MSMTRAMGVRLAAAVLVAVGGAAAADPKSDADDLFARAKSEMAAKDYAAACPKFEQAYKLDPGIGGMLNVGKCYEDWGKLVKALHAYQDAEQQAKRGRDGREARIHQLVGQLLAQVPRIALHVVVGVDVTRLGVAIDGVAVPAEQLAAPVLVEPGTHTIEYMGGDVKRSKEVKAQRGALVDVTLDVETVATPPVPVTPEPLPAHPQPAPPQPPIATKPPAIGPTQPPTTSPAQTGSSWSTLKIVGVADAAAGVIGIGVGSYLALSAKSSYDDALKNDCMNMKTACNAAGLSATGDARSRANIATIVDVVGLAAVASGVVLYLIAPKAAASEHAYYVAPTPNGVAFGGRL